MKVVIGLLLTLIGIGIVVYGVGSALMPVIGMYEGAMNDPLASNDAAEKAVPGEMMRAVLIGAAGIPFIIAGKVFLILAWRGRVRERRAALARRGRQA